MFKAEAAVKDAAVATVSSSGPNPLNVLTTSNPS